MVCDIPCIRCTRNWARLAQTLPSLVIRPHITVQRQKRIRKWYRSIQIDETLGHYIVHTRTYAHAYVHIRSSACIYIGVYICMRLAASARLFSNVPLTSCRICIHIQGVWWTVVQTEIKRHLIKGESRQIFFLSRQMAELLNYLIQSLSRILSNIDCRGVICEFSLNHMEDKLKRIMAVSWTLKKHIAD